MRQRGAQRGQGSLWDRLTGSERAFRIALAGAGALAVLLRLAHQASLEGVLGHRQILDAAFYHDEARYLVGALSTPVEPGPVRFANPGYSELLAVLYRLFIPDERVGLTAQALGSGVTAIVLGLSANALFKDRRAGLIAAFYWAFYAPSIYYDGALLTPSLGALLTTLAVGALIRVLDIARGAGSRRSFLTWGFAAGLCVGGATLLRPSNVLLGLSLAGVLLIWGRTQRQLRAAALALTLGVVLVITPRIFAQHAATGDWIPLSANGGMNLWVGNNRDANGSYGTAPFVDAYRAQGHEYTVVVERNAYLDEARRLSGDSSLGIAQSSAFWRNRAQDEVSADPPRWLGLELKKLTWFWNRYESRTNVSQSFLEHFSTILRFDPWGFGVCALLGGYGLLTMRQSEARARLLLAAVVAAPLLTCLVFFVSGEYRHPASCALVLAASFALSRLSRLDAARPWALPHGQLRTAALAALVLLVVYPVERPSDGDNAKAYADWLVTVHPDGEKPTRESYDRAEIVLETLSDSLADSVLKAQTLLLLYSNRAIQFADVEAAESLTVTASKLWQLDPTPLHGVPTHIALRVHGDLFLRIRALAAQPFIERNPSLDSKLALLGSHDYAEVDDYVAQKRVALARAFATDALRLAPTSVEAMAARGRVELLAGQPDAARPWLERGLAAWPKLALPAVLLSQCALMSGDAPRAASYLQEAIERDPADLRVRELRESMARPNPGAR